MPTAREQLAIALKEARLTAGFDSQGKLARAMHISRPSVNKAESGTQPVPTEPLLMSWAKATGADVPTLLELVHRCKSSTPEWFMPYLTAEQGATRIQFWAPMVIPGLLQTEAYARALEEPDAVVVQRMERQQVIKRAQVTAVIASRVLVNPIGGPAVMTEQCAHLVNLAETRQIRLHIATQDGNLGLGGAIAIASRNGVVTVNMGTFTRDITSTAPDVIDETLSAFDAVLGASLPVVQSVEFARTQEETWRAQL